MIRIDHHDNAEYAGVRQDLEVDGGISALGNRDGDSGGDQVAAKRHCFCRATDMCHQSVKPTLVIHVEPVSPEPRQEPEQPAENRDRRRTGRRSLVGLNGRFHPGKAYANTPVGRDTDKHRGLTRLPTAEPSPVRRPDTGTVITIRSTVSPLPSKI
jgi:hypothetical protein